MMFYFNFNHKRKHLCEEITKKEQKNEVKQNKNKIIIKLIFIELIIILTIPKLIQEN